jgi:hypothetical protein
MAKNKWLKTNIRFCMLVFAVCLWSYFCTGCATPKVVAPAAYDFSKIHKISVTTFQGQGGAVVADEFVKALLTTGIEVSDASHPADAVLKGTVSDYKSANPLTVFLGNTSLLAAGGQTIAVDNAVVSNIESQSPAEAAAHIHGAQVISMVSSVNIYVSLIDPSTKNVLWGGSYSYEGLDLPETVQTVVGMAMLNLAKMVPAMNKPHA